MTSSTVLSTCNEAGMIPLCTKAAPHNECFSPGESVKTIMEASNCGPTKFWANADCFYMNYVFAYRKDGNAKVLKAENSTDRPDEISWKREKHENVGLSGQDGKNFYALCQYVFPTTTTTTTTTTVAPRTLSREEMEQHLTKTECPLTQNTGHWTDSSSKNKKDLPQIDIFLNPERKGELDLLKLWVEKNEENLTYTEVRHAQHHSQKNSTTASCCHWYPSPGCSLPNLSQRLRATVALHATLLSLHRQPGLAPHAPPMLLAGK